jgi:hypothetical protein
MVLPKSLTLDNVPYNLILKTRIGLPVIQYGTHATQARKGKEKEQDIEGK